ncbi:MAG: ATP-binding protein [bacterium]
MTTGQFWLVRLARRHRALPALTAVVVLSLSATLGVTLHQREEREIERSVSLKAHSLAALIQSRLWEHSQSLTQLASSNPGDAQSRGAWEVEALHIVQAELYHSISLMDSANRDVASIPGTASAVDSPREHAAERAAVAAAARSTGVVTTSPPLFGANGMAMFFTAVPTARGAGAVIAESLIPTVMRQALSVTDVTGYSVAIFADGSELFSRATGTRDLEQRWAGSAPIGDRGAAWSLRVWPTEAELASRRSWLPEAVFLLGSLLALGLAFMVRLYEMADDRAHALASANLRLEGEIKERERAQDALGRSEEQLRQSQKMEAVGRLAGGIAHDFNNLLTAINGYADFLLTDIDRADPRRDDVREIKKAATRAGALTKQLLSFSRRQIRQPRCLDLNAVLTDLEKMLRRVIGEDVTIDWQPSERLGTVKADPSDIEQVLMNLVVNARDAMPNGGTITVTTSTVSFERGAAHLRLAAGRYVRLSVSDNGMGMDPATRARIFEPFFTTKGPGKGTGLGLSTVYAIVETLHGGVDVDSEIGSGTTFTVYLPQHEEPAEAIGSGTMSTVAPRGVETVLLVEDEEAVRALGARILERHGYTVLEARNGRDALTVAHQHPGPIDLLLTDVVMPEMGGKQLSEALLARDACMRVLFVSGYTDGDISRRGELDPCTAFLQKPFTAKSLLGRVREVLDGEAVAA